MIINLDRRRSDAAGGALEFLSQVEVRFPAVHVLDDWLLFGLVRFLLNGYELSFREEALRLAVSPRYLSQQIFLDSCDGVLIRHVDSSVPLSCRCLNTDLDAGTIFNLQSCSGYASGVLVCQRERGLINLGLKVKSLVHMLGRHGYGRGSLRLLRGQ